MAPHSSTLAWKILWAEEPGGLQSMGSLRVRHNWATSLSRIAEGNGNPLQCSCLENPRDGRAWWAAVYGVPRSRTRLKQLSSGSSSCYLVSGSILPISIRQLDFDPNSCMSSNRHNLWDLGTEPHPVFPGVSLCSERLLPRVDSKSYLWSPFLSTPHWTLSLWDFKCGLNSVYLINSTSDPFCLINGHLWIYGAFPLRWPLGLLWLCSLGWLEYFFSGNKK